MSNFTPTVKESIEFDGDTVQLVLRRLKIKHSMMLASHIRTSDGNTVMNFAEFTEMAEKAGQILPDCVVSMTGLTGTDGTPLAISDILSEAYFQELIVGILTKLILHSSVAGAAAAKNSAAPLPGPSTALEQKE